MLRDCSSGCTGLTFSSGGTPTVAGQVEANYLASDVRSFLTCLDGEAIAYIQSYEADERGVVGIDQFLANPNQLNRGFGTALVTQFVEFLFADPSIEAVIVDPVPANGRAIRCYEKAGFRFVGMRDGAYIMKVRKDFNNPTS